MATKSGFLAIYETMLRERTAWAKDADKLAHFMAAVAQTLSPEGPRTWLCAGEIVTAAWKAAGGKGKPTVKALSALT